ncbi:MAG: hypothetical protein M3Y49_04280 [Actinomycetota bacterium]|nr:hypothetical protein [Actinomycetota bacterium]
MSILNRATATAALLILPFSLAACGGGSDKPSKADAQAGFSKLLKSETGASSANPALLEKLSKCVVDKTYDKLTTRTLKAMASGDKNSKGDDKDKTTLTDANQACAKSVAAGG